MNEEEILRRNNVLMSSGKLPEDMTTCETYGISGNCGMKCPLFKQGVCEVQEDVANRVIKELEHNWNELKKWLEENKYFYSGYQGEDLEEDISIIGALNKIKELEEGGNNE